MPGAQAGGRPDLTLRDFLSLARRHWVLALAVFTVVFGAAVGSTWLIDPVYRSQADVLLRTQDSQQLFPRTSRATAQSLNRAPVAEREFTSSDAFLTAAREAGRGTQDVEVRLDSPDSSTLRFVAEAPTPEAAAAAADSWAATYVSVRHAQDVEEARRLRETLIAERDAAEAQRKTIAAPLDSLDQTIAKTTDPTELSRLLNQRLIVQRSLAAQLDPVEDRLRSLNAQIAEVDVDVRVLQNPEASASVSNEAAVPSSRANGSLLRNAVVGLVSGLALAAAAVTATRDRLPRPRRRAAPLHSVEKGLDPAARRPTRPSRYRA